MKSQVIKTIIGLMCLSMFYLVVLVQPDPAPVKGYMGKPIITVNGELVMACDTEGYHDVLQGQKDRLRNTLSTVYKVAEGEVDWWANHLVEAAVKYEVPTEVLVSLVATESHFRPYPKGRYDYIHGPAQVSSLYWQGVEGYDITKPDENIYAGAYILSQYKETCGDWACAAKAYNVGLTNFNKGYQQNAQKRYINKIESNLVLLDAPSVYVF